MELGLEGKVCVVTGSTGALATCVVEQIRGEGALAVSSDRSPHGPGDLHVSLDLAGAGEPERLLETTLQRFGRLDGLVNCVAAADPRSLADLTEDDWRASFERNLMTVVRLTRAALPALLEARGAIVNVASIAGLRPSTGLPDYAVSKAALLSFSRLVADLHAADGIRCNAVTPGPTAAAAAEAGGGLADPAGIASAIVFLLSARASHVNGAAWSADAATVPIII